MFFIFKYGPLFNAWGTGIGAFGYLVSAYLGNKFGRREIILIWFLLGGIAGTCFAFALHTAGQMSFWWAMYYFFTVGHTGAFIPFVMESFPTRSRGTGASFISFATWGGLLLAGLTSQFFASPFGVIIATFLWLGIGSWVALLFNLGTKRVKLGLEMEEIITRVLNDYNISKRFI